GARGGSGFPLRARALPAQPNPRERFGRGRCSPPSFLGGADDDVEGLHALELDPEPPGTLPRLVEGEGRNGVAARASAATAPATHHTARGHADSGADPAAHAPELSHADPDGAAVAAPARGLGELDRLGVEERAVRLHDLRALETTAARVDLDAETVGGDAVGR